MQEYCCQRDQYLISEEMLSSLGIKAGSIYENETTIARLAQAMVETTGTGYAILPFCHTVEAKALGADILPADAAAGPRPGRYVYDTLSQIPLHSFVHTPEIQHLLAACQELHRAGNKVAFQITGPISMLSCLMDLSSLFRTWRKQPDAVSAFLEQLVPLMLEYVEAICCAGADAISYADPAGTGTILGPRYTKAILQLFTLPFLQAASKYCADRTALMVCPLTMADLTKTSAFPPECAAANRLLCRCVKAPSKPLLH